MGKIIKDGFAFMEYVNSGLIRKIDDIPELLGLIKANMKGIHMSGASAVIHKQNKLIRLFNETGAIDAEHAILINKYGIRRSFVFDRMVLRGVFVECEPGRFYINNDAVPMFKAQRRNRALIALVFVLLIAVLYYLVVGAYN